MKYLMLICAGYLPLCVSSAQELSTARYVGSLEGGAQACAEAFPQKAAIYNDTLYRSVKCHLSESEFQQWRNKLRNQAPHREQYLEAYAEGKNSLSDHPANRKRECASLESLACDPGSDPRRDPDFKK
ncbi:MAG: hypothetical protein V4495_10370 [Pseudomonadota bacterium]